MREGIGGAYLFNIVITVILLLILVLIGSLSYVKAFRVGNRIIDIIEQYDGYNVAALAEINTALGEIGYRVGNKTCPTATAFFANDGSYVQREGITSISVTGEAYDYCIYKHNLSRGEYYTIVTYIYFELPAVGVNLRIPVSNQSKTLKLIGGD